MAEVSTITSEARVVIQTIAMVGVPVGLVPAAPRILGDPPDQRRTSCERRLGLSPHPVEPFPQGRRDGAGERLPGGPGELTGQTLGFVA